jgi:hypothetical protein
MRARGWQGVRWRVMLRRQLTEFLMTDKPTTPPPAAPEAPDHFQEHLKGEHHQAKKGVKDTGTIVSSAGGELIDGRIADITDGDR